MQRNVEPELWTVTFSQGLEQLLLTRLGIHTFRAEETSLFGEFSYLDIIGTDLQSEGNLRFVKILEKSPLKTSEWLIPKGFVDAPSTRAFLDHVVELGGNWEGAFGGLLLLHPPPTHEAAALREFKAIFPAASNS